MTHIPAGKSRLQCVISDADKKLLQSINPSQGYLTFITTQFFRSLADDCRKLNLTGYSPTNIETLASLVRQRTDPRPLGDADHLDDRGAKTRLRDASSDSPNKPAGVVKTTQLRGGRSRTRGSEGSKSREETKGSE